MTRPRTLAVLVLGTLLWSGVDPVGAADFFLDDFEDGDATDGSPVKWVVPSWVPNGQQKVDEGSLIITPSDISPDLPGYDAAWTEMDLLTDGVSLQDVSIRTRVRGLEPATAVGRYWIGLSARDNLTLESVTGSSLFAAISSDGELALGGLVDDQQNGPASQLDFGTRQTGLNFVAQDVNLQFDLIGNQLQAWAWTDAQQKPALPQVVASVSPALVQAGELVLWSFVRSEDFDKPVAFRYVEAAQVELDVAGAGQPGPMPVSGDISGGQLGPVEGVQPGLLQRWFSVSNPMTYDNVIETVYDPTSPGTSLEPDVPAFHSAHTWWTGTDTRVSGTTNYPAEIWGHPRTQDSGDWNSSDNERYTVALEGEIFIPESGKYRFVDGIDDLAVFGIDLNRDGVVDPGQDELLIDDNVWTSVDRSQNAGGLPSNVIPSATFSDIAPGGEWFKVQSFVAEGEIGDAGIFYWDYDAADRDGDGIRLGDAPGFPTSARGNGRTIAGENLSNLFIPDTHLRSEGGQALIAGQVDAKLAQAIYKFELGTDGTHDELTVERPAAAVSTKLDLNDATLELVALGEPKLGEYRLLVADQFQGKATLKISESLSLWFDTSRLLSEGLLAVVLPGDANGDHKVDLSDFGILKEQFGAGTTRSQGDFNSDAKVDLTDFGILKSHFGKTGSTAVPEPSTGFLAGLALLSWAASTSLRRKFRSGDLGAGQAWLGALLIGLFQAAPVEAQFFLDDFDDGVAFDGNPVKWVLSPPYDQGTHQVLEGEYVLQPPDAPDATGYTEVDVTPDAVISGDVSIRSEVRALDAADFWLGLAARTTYDLGGVANSSAWAAIRPSGELQIGTFSLEANQTSFSSFATTLNPRAADVILQFDVYGNTAALTAWTEGTEKPSAPQLAVKMPTYVADEGNIGLWTGSVLGEGQAGARAAYDYFEAAPVELHVGGLEQTGELSIAGDFSGGQLGPAEGVQPGLLQRWFSANNPGTYDNVLDNVYDPQSPDTSLTPDVPAFHSAHTWWTGTGRQVAGTATYPAEIQGQPRTQDAGDWNGVDNERYTVALEGEIFIPESGAYRFADGVDDLAIFGIDSNRDGVVAESELLINDNDWTSIDRSENTGGLPSNVFTLPKATFNDIPAGGEWLKVQAFVAEGEIGDSGIFYWDYDATDRDGDGKKLGDAPGFPTSARGTGRTIAGENLPHLFIPDTHLRSAGGQELIAGQVDAKLARVIYKLELGADGKHDELAVERPAAAVSTRLDLNDATLALSALGEPKLGEYRLLVADQLQGKASLAIPEALAPWFDTSRLLSEGLLAVVLPGDANGDHRVDLSDFGILKEHFGAGTSRAQGDFNFDAKVDLTDFGILKEHFGKAAATAVPEPSGLLLAGLAMLGVSLTTCRRRGATGRRGQ